MDKLTVEYFLEATEGCPVIPEIKNEEWLAKLGNSDSKLAYILYGDICTIADIVAEVKKIGKMAIVHVDLVTGLSSREISIDFLQKYTRTDGIISMKPALIKRANELGFFTIQRFYMMDEFTYRNIEKHIKSCNPDMVEFMPAGLSKVMKYLVSSIDKHVIASGLTQDESDVIAALRAGAIAVATSNLLLWDC